jgi:hypothetical protein
MQAERVDVHLVDERDDRRLVGGRGGAEHGSMG